MNKKEVHGWLKQIKVKGCKIELSHEPTVLVIHVPKEFVMRVFDYVGLMCRDDCFLLEVKAIDFKYKRPKRTRNDMEV